MKNNEIIFKLNEQEKIIVKLEESLNDIHCCSSAPIIFVKNNKEYLLSDTSILSVRDNMQLFRYLIEATLSGNFKLDNSIRSSKSDTRDIGYFFNELRQGKPGFSYELNKEGTGKDWIGDKYMLWGKEAIAWMYNNDNGEIIFEVTPCFPGNPTYLNPTESLSKEEIENLAYYEEWIKEYQPIAITKISREVAQQWLKQVNDILEKIEQNIKRMHAQEKFKSDK